MISGSGLLHDLEQLPFGIPELRSFLQMCCPCPEHHDIAANMQVMPLGESVETMTHAVGYKRQPKHLGNRVERLEGFCI